MLTLLHADFRVTLRQAAGSADLVVTSPPYADARTYGADVSWDMDSYRALGDGVFAALRPGGHCLMVLDAPVRAWRSGVGTERGFLPWFVMLDWAERVGFRVPDRLAYLRHGSPGEYGGRFRNDWEPLLWFQRPGAPGYFDKWALAEKARYGTKPGFASLRQPDGTMYVRTSSGCAVNEGKRHRGTVWDYGNIGHGRCGGEDTGHPARFCARLAEDVVRCFCPWGGLVVDPFLGSGTSAVAAVRYGRRFLGGDILCRDDGTPWVDVARARVAREADPIDIEMTTF
jgi:DNA modification methylase